MNTNELSYEPRKTRKDLRLSRVFGGSSLRALMTINGIWAGLTGMALLVATANSQVKEMPSSLRSIARTCSAA